MAEPRNKLISLFCGPGGFDVGFHQAGFETRLAADIDVSAVITHRQNFPKAEALVCDLSSEAAFEYIWGQCLARFHEEPPVGIIGGPPCQSFSVGNAHKKDDDPRHQLPITYVRFVDGLNRRLRGQIDFFVFENVVSIRSAASYLDFKQKVREIGFNVFEAELNAVDFEVPQVRRRLFIVGINQKRYPQFRKRPFEFPQGTTNRVACETVFQQVRHEPVIANSGLTPKEVREVAGHWNHWCMEPVSRKFSCSIEVRSYRGKKYKVAVADHTKQSPLEKPMGGKSFKVLDPRGPSYTVAYGHREVHIHPNRHRRLSVYEAMLLQGFPKEYQLMGSLSDQIRLVSEVVAPPVAYLLALAIKNQLGL